MGLCGSVPRDSSSATEKNLPIKQISESNGYPRGDCVGFKSQVSPLNNLESSNRSFGSKDDTFYESQVWLDSDCDDDFYSVNGEFTPSRGSTPVHGMVAGFPKFKKTFSLQSSGALSESKPTPLNTDLTPLPPVELDKAPAEADTTPRGETSTPDSMLLTPTSKKKLLELFRESRTEEEMEDLTLSDLANENNTADGMLDRNPSIKKSANATPYLSGTNSVSSGERTPNGDSVNPVKQKSRRSPLSCFPKLMSNLSFHGTKTPHPSVSVDV